MSKRKRTFHVSATMKIGITIDVAANSLEEALEQARAMCASDFFTANNEEETYDWDDDFQITGVYE